MCVLCGVEFLKNIPIFPRPCYGAPATAGRKTGETNQTRGTNIFIGAERLQSCVQKILEAAWEECDKVNKDTFPRQHLFY